MDAPVYGWNDFQTLELSIEGMNHTSQIPIEGSSRSGLRITELTENGAWLEMPAKSCAVGHTLSIKILAKTILNRAEEITTTPTADPKSEATEAVPLHFTAMVDAVETDTGTGPQQVLISFRQHTPEEWFDLVRYFTEKQAKLNALLWRTRQ